MWARHAKDFRNEVAHDPLFPMTQFAPNGKYTVYPFGADKTVRQGWDAAVVENYFWPLIWLSFSKSLPKTSSISARNAA